MSDIKSIIEKVRKISRKDKGVGGDEQRLTQLVWMLFLKVIDDVERDEKELIDPKYKSPIPEEFRWRNWGAQSDGITGDELISFVEIKLFPGLKNIQVTKNPYSKAIKSVFEDTNNFIKSGTHLRQICNEISKINFGSSKEDRDVLGDVYEKLLNEIGSAINKGEYYTPRPVTLFTVEMLKPELGEIILDPACGTGGFLLGAIDYIRNHSLKNNDDYEKMLNNIRGIELKAFPHLLAVTNMILHGVPDPSIIRRDDMLSYPLASYGPKDRVDLIIANPPFSGEIVDGTELNFPQNFRTKSTASMFLVLFIHLLKEEGRAGIILPDGSLFGDGVDARIREELLTKCNLHTIIRLPSKTFLATGTNTNILFFQKGKPTDEVWYYKLPLPSGMKNYTKGRPIKHEDFEPVKEWWDNREENENAWKVSIEDIKVKNWNLDFKNPRGGEMEEELGSKELVERILNKEDQIKGLLRNI